MIWIFLPIFIFAGVIENNITSIYKQTYPNIKISHIQIKNKIPKKIYYIDTSSINTKRLAGTIRVNNSFVFYRINAKLPVLISTQIINRNEILTKENTKLKYISFKNFYSYPVTDYTNKISKMYIPKNKIIYDYMIKTPYDVKKYDKIHVTSKSGGIELVLEGIALQNGNIGDVIKVKINNKKYNVLITAKGKAKL